MKRFFCAALLWGAAAFAASADVIYFKSGAEREVKEVLYVKDETLFFRTLDENTIGVPASSVERWERRAVSDDAKKVQAEKSAKAEGEAPPATSPRSEASQTRSPADSLDARPDGSVADSPLLKRVFTVGDIPVLEGAFAANSRKILLRRVLARAHSQIAVEQFLLDDEPSYSLHMRRARLLAPADKTLALVDEVHHLLKNEQREEAAQRLRLAKDVAESDYRLLLLEGRAAYESGRLARALEAWREAAKMKPSFQGLQELLAQAAKELAVQENFGNTATAHFVFEYDQAVDARAAKEIAEMLEAAYARVTYELSYYPNEPLRVLLYANADFEAVTGLPVDYVEGLYDGKIRLPLKGLLRRREHLVDTLTHETAHAVVYFKTKGNAGRWLQEGLAQHFEEAADPGRYAASYLRGFEKAGGTPRPSDYPSALLWIAYLADAYDFSYVKELLDALAKNPDEEAAYLDVFGFTKAELGGRWLPYLRGLAKPRSPFERYTPLR